jgi:DNA-binding transcriptional LysR family regulator
MERLVPSLQAAEAFLAVARASSLRMAARQLALSPSALSRRIQTLEDFVGAPLFRRTPSGLILTGLGCRYLADIEPAVQALRQATLALRDGGNPIRMAASHTFTTEWLLPRMTDLWRRHGLRVNIVVGDPIGALQSGRADIAIKGGLRPHVGLECEPLGESAEAVLVAAAHLADGRSPPRTAHELELYSRLSASDNAEIWRQWLTAVGRADLQPAQTQSYDTLQMAYEAAANGFGVTLAFPLVAERFLRTKRLAPCFDSRRRIEGRYWIVQNRWTSRAISGRDLQTLLAWVRAEANTSLGYFSAWTETAAA